MFLIINDLGFVAPILTFNWIRYVTRKSACTRENSLSNLITIEHGRNLTFPYWIITSFSEQSTSLSCLGTCVRQICNSIGNVFFSTGKNDRLRYNNNLDKLFSFILNLPRSVQLECQQQKKILICLTNIRWYVIWTLKEMCLI